MLTRNIKLLVIFIALQATYANNISMRNVDWWPKQLDLSPLKINQPDINPLPKDFDYRKEFNRLDIEALIHDLQALMTSSQAWWPADYGTYAPFFIRMAWHSAGTYRIADGRGGAEGAMQRFAPLNSWPDNTNLDKARRLLWPIKQKYGNQISWSDLMVLAGNVALESMGFKTIGFAGGRIDAWEPENTDWGPETKWLENQRQNPNGQLKQPYGATQMGLIYVNPEGPAGNPDPKKAAQDIRVTFARMAMNDEETVALIAGGHAFGKAHGAASATKYLGPSPESAPIQAQGFGWKNSYQTGYGPNTITSGLEGAWSSTPTRWSNNYLENLFHFDWIPTKSPSGATQWIPDNPHTHQLVPDAYDAQKKHPPMMFTTDLSLKYDPAYRKISENFLKHPEELQIAFAKAWFKLMHRDMGPRSRYLGKLVPKEVFLWQDPVPTRTYELIDDNDIKALKSNILQSKLTIPQLVSIAWASASSFRGTDMRGGANGGRIRLQPQISWAVNNPQEMLKVIQTLENIQQSFNQKQTTHKQVSFADIVVLAGAVGIEKAIENAGFDIKVPFFPGRTDATQAMTDIQSFEVLKPKADAFRNYLEQDNTSSPEQLMVEKASMLQLTIPEMTCLIGGMRVLNANYNHHPYGVFTVHPEQLSNDFFINLLDMSIQWKESSQKGVYDGVNRETGQLKWQGTQVDLIFGSNAELRAIAEFYAQVDSKEKFIHDFVNAWVKVMNLDRFDLKK